MRGATDCFKSACFNKSISIHAPRAGRDRALVAGFALHQRFQSTRPVRGATGEGQSVDMYGLFQSTRPVRGATVKPMVYFRYSKDFNPRAPCGARLSVVSTSIWPETFQSTRPVRGATAGH